MREAEPALNGTGLNGASSSVQAVPDKIVTPCPRCRDLTLRRELEKTLMICPRCGYHHRLTAKQRITYLVDDITAFQEYDRDLTPQDPLHFVSRAQVYATKLKENQNETELSEAVVGGIGTIEGIRVSLAVMDFHFIGGSMGMVAGERLARAMDRAADMAIPLIICSASGGARMQENIFSLFQLAKTSATLTRLRNVKMPYISVLTDPTTGGVTASFASLGDVILAEPNAMVGFAGPRVIEQAIHQRLPSGTDTSEFVLEHGMIDAVVDRRSLRETIARILRFYTAS